MNRESYEEIKNMELAAASLREQSVLGIEQEVADFIDSMAAQLLAGNGVYDSCDDPGAVRTASRIARLYLDKIAGSPLTPQDAEVDRDVAKAHVFDHPHQAQQVADALNAGRPVTLDMLPPQTGYSGGWGLTDRPSGGTGVAVHSRGF